MYQQYKARLLVSVFELQKWDNPIIRIAISHHYLETKTTTDFHSQDKHFLELQGLGITTHVGVLL